MSRLWARLFGRPPEGRPAAAAVPAALRAVGGGAGRPRVFDPAVKHYPAAFRPGDPGFHDPASAESWGLLRRQATDHVLRRVAESAWGDRLILRGSRTLRAWLGGAAREPGDLDWVVDPPTVGPADPGAAGLVADLSAAVLAPPWPAGVVFVPSQVTTDDIWTYERAPGRRVVFPWKAAGLPNGAVQVDVVFGERLADPARRTTVEAADGGCVAVRAATPAQSLAWKLAWLATDFHPQGKDLYDAVLLAERFPLPAEVLERTFRHADAGPVPTTAAALVRDWRVDWDNFRADYPGAGGDAAGWLGRLTVALAPTFLALAGEAPVRPAPPDGFDPAWRTPAVVGLAAGVAADRAWDRLPILADALEDAGCDDGETLTHCRAGGPHAGGCRVVDRILGQG